MGESIHVRDVDFGDVEPMLPPERTIVTVIAPRGLMLEEEEVEGEELEGMEGEGVEGEEGGATVEEGTAEETAAEE
jgi:hypothetical protein